MALLTLLAGCSEGVHWPGVTSIRWHGPTYQDAHAVAQREHKLTFVYFRNWYLKDCTEFEEHMLGDLEVVGETRSLICTVLDFDWDRPLAEKWGIKMVPGFVITTPDDEVLVKQQRPISRDELLKALRLAKEKFGGSAKPPATLPRLWPKAQRDDSSGPGTRG